MRRVVHALLTLAVAVAPLAALAVRSEEAAAVEYGGGNVVDWCTIPGGWGCDTTCADGAISGNGMLIGYNIAPGEQDPYPFQDNAGNLHLYFCPAQWQSGMMSIGGGKSHTYTLSHKLMQPRHVCYWRSSSAVWPSAGIAYTSSSYTAYNSVSDTRHWAFGGSFYAGSGKYLTPAGYNDTQCQTQNGCIGYGAAAGCYSTAPASATTAGATVPATAAAFRPTPLPTVAGDEAGASLTVVNQVTDRTGTRAVSCPAGTTVLHADTAVRQPEELPIVEPLVDHDRRTARFTITTLNPGAVVDLHVICRDATARLHHATDGHVTGTDGHERHTTSRHDTHVMSGGGNDIVDVHHNGTTVVAGHGNDRVTTSADQGSVNGGPGHDVLVATGTGTVLLEGGSGPDLLVAERGSPILNAEDGKPGDRIRCMPGSTATVLMDRGDVVSGPCTVVRRG